MGRIVIVGAGLYGLIAAKTYLQVTGAYDSEDTAKRIDDNIEIPTCFTEHTGASTQDPSETHLLVIDSASDIGGTWAEERLYPNLFSQNSYGLYEFSDLPLSRVVPEEDGNDTRNQFIAGWKINRYLRAWVEKWRLDRYIRLNWTVRSISRLESKEWKLDINIAGNPCRNITVICDKLVLATGLTSVPNMPDTNASSMASDIPVPVIHAKDVGIWARKHMGYEPLKATKSEAVSAPVNGSPYSQLRSVAIYGGAKSSFDLVHFFATLHRNDPKLRLRSTQDSPVQVHWIIRDRGAGPSWMVPPTSTLPNGDTVASDKAASTRLLSHLTPCCYEIPKRLSFGPSGSPHWEGSWLARLFHGNPLGRWWIRSFWRSVDKGLEDTAQYGSDAKMEKLRPENSVVSCVSGIGIANQGDLWEAIRLPHVNIYRSVIADIAAASADKTADSATRATVHLSDGSRIDALDLVIHATGYKPIVPIRFSPTSLRLKLGLSALVSSVSGDRESHGDCLISADSPERIDGPLEETRNARIQHWDGLDRKSEVLIKQTLDTTGCALTDRSPPSWATSRKLLPYRLFRRMVAPELVAEGDRSFATLGVILSSTIAVIAEAQALWVAAFLTGGLDAEDLKSPAGKALSLADISLETMESAISEDVVLGSLTGTGLEVDAIQYNDMLMRDLGLNPYRLGGGFYTELTGVYGPSAYAGIVEEWRKSRGMAQGQQ
ncbi:uncharacterized protein N7515_001235 [Penicillium bovifimosum]|uniref:FAD/NAD(P)-binding domain-containing protein n=1 Tax=Penicillium bovifimosum TaxID=126998 RepID=A0A9W9HB58_9EURO|nr:uncharacterized protein N7515_001235 [Penicillium bovifimosum]KAJ5142448.1 hypothetical protein N7515_001235 [Penicillium bovifimosum]